MIVHSMTGQSKEAKIGKVVVTTKCGATLDRNAAAPLPLDVTAWGSLVTCPDCLKEMR